MNECYDGLFVNTILLSSTSSELLLRSCIIMFKSRLLPNDAKAIRHPYILAVKRKSESDDSSDYRTSLESPTTHCYVVGTRPKRTFPRRALSTGQVEITAAIRSIDNPSVRMLHSGVCGPIMTPPRSKSATNLRTFDRKDPILPIPHIGTRRIYTPRPLSLLRFYDLSRKSLDNKMDIDPSSSSQSISRKLNHLRLRSTMPLRAHKSAASLRPMISSLPLRRQASQNSISTSATKTPKYVSDEDMHLCTSTEEDDSDLEGPTMRSIPSSATFFRNIRMQQMLRNSQCDENMSPSTSRRTQPATASFSRSKKTVNLLQSSNHTSAPPLVIIDKCKPSVMDHHQAKRVKRSRHGLAPPTFQ